MKAREINYNYTNDELKKIGKYIQEHYTSRLLKDPNLKSVGISYKITDNEVKDEIAISFFVKQKKNLSDLSEEELIKSFHLIEDLKVLTDVVEIERLHRNDKVLADLNHFVDRTQKFDVVQAGISVGWKKRHRTTGTLGVIVFRDGKPFAMSNYHVFKGRGARVIQPGGIDSTSVLHDLGVVKWSDRALDCSISSIEDREVDRSVFGFKSQVIIDTHGEVNLGDEVVKSGRGSEITYGEVYCIKSIANIRGRILSNQFYIKPHKEFRASDCEISKNFDSGSAWIKLVNKQPSNIILGLHNGGDPSDNDLDCESEFARATEIDPIVQKFQISFKP